MSARTAIAAGTALALLLAACGDEPDDPAAADPPPTEDDRLEPEPPAEDDDRADAEGALTDEIRTAVDDAADRADVSPDEVQVATAELVTWPDGALGCPESDRMYTMALVHGYRIVLEVDGEELAYHGAEGSPPAYCAEPEEPADAGDRVTD